MISFQRLSEIFSYLLNDTLHSPQDELENLVGSLGESNRKLWQLEDSARLVELGPEHVALAKQEIDKTNQARNNTILKIDLVLENEMHMVPLDSQAQFYNETPGGIIDRLSILYIKHFEIKRLLTVINEEDLREEYGSKKQIVSKQLNNLGVFFDVYLRKLQNKEIFFTVQPPVKIYNDPKIKKYIKLLLPGSQSSSQLN